MRGVGAEAFALRRKLRIENGRTHALALPCPTVAYPGPSMPTILLLTISNLFMTAAWYWHLKGGMNKPLFAVILISWGIAFVEYCFAVPANRIGFAHGWSAGQLKLAQEAIAQIGRASGRERGCK